MALLVKMPVPCLTSHEALSRFKTWTVIDVPPWLKPAPEADLTEQLTADATFVFRVRI
ncbi:Hypothetical protein PMT_2459 [Prochlorococcus marinus str. MIT 9313]|uniref:Uncharacterized protein n=1 Tax=Prochlorococcus marinus (strain MIT 9313) TaxID=74547 RepID=B9ERB0_PROMM|nr:hypothetical protein [Prochlorococcus marinus]CAX31977.1 Hypothetical protein PMT_2459 [Prochlorococcus marinus str. MIT 9313]